MAGEHAMDLLTAADRALASIALPPPANPLPRGVRPFPWEELSGVAAETQTSSAELDPNAVLNLRIEIGRTHIGRDEVSKLRTGSVVPLDNTAADPVDLYAEGQLVARGEALAIDGKLAVRVVEIISRAGDH
jgi:flagellar motor switch protein FliN